MPVEATGWTVVSIDKQKPGEALVIGKRIAQIVGLAKVVVVVDKDVDVLNRTQVMYMMGARWQPYPAAEIVKDMMGMPLDPSSPNRPKSAKIIIDATKQWPEEGGPTVYPEYNRELLTRLAPGSFAIVDQNWERYLKGWNLEGWPQRSV
jgi:3-polyprenyl-4-hydroxybenzoate decarboxylase